MRGKFVADGKIHGQAAQSCHTALHHDVPESGPGPCYLGDVVVYIVAPSPTWIKCLTGTFHSLLAPHCIAHFFFNG
jgi:hypothetical protein